MRAKPLRSVYWTVAICSDFDAEQGKGGGQLWKSATSPRELAKHLMVL